MRAETDGNDGLPAWQSGKREQRQQRWDRLVDLYDLGREPEMAPVAAENIHSQRSRTFIAYRHPIRMDLLDLDRAEGQVRENHHIIRSYGARGATADSRSNHIQFLGLRRSGEGA